MIVDSNIGGNIVTPTEDDPLLPLFAAPPTVRILLYTDDSRFNLDAEPPNNDFGLRPMHDLIVNNAPWFVNFEFEWMNRHNTGHARYLLTEDHLARCDEVWFFGGTRYANDLQNPNNELTDTEVNALRSWMGRTHQGGVVITGDHSNRVQGVLLNLGRALGYRIPRARELRKWEGPPDAISDIHNTQVPDGVHRIDDLALQQDERPQQLILKKYTREPIPIPEPPIPDPQVQWPPRPLPRPHPIFQGRTGDITVYPDHMHQGELVIPATFPIDVWPKGLAGQPLPEVIASGTDKRNGRVYGVVTAYDGHRANVGRIVAHGTWHNKVRANLRGFPPGGPTLNAITESFVNEAVWLSSPSRLREMRHAVVWWAANHPAVDMVAGNSISIVGITAYNLLQQVASEGIITELIWPSQLSPELGEPYPWHIDALVLGGIVDQYHQAFAAARAGERVPSPDELAIRGVQAAHKAHRQSGYTPQVCSANAAVHRGAVPICPKRRIGLPTRVEEHRPTPDMAGPHEDRPLTVLMLVRGPNSQAWRVKDSNLGRHTPTDLQPSADQANTPSVTSTAT